jgi:hypothetical protein
MVLVLVGVCILEHSNAKTGKDYTAVARTGSLCSNSRGESYYIVYRYNNLGHISGA